ncbi:hypothetical protein D1007_08583 [Hordeum vulgare]|nr:hypothetical protein D1007_08583 [Hordeum vulgare]
MRSLSRRKNVLLSCGEATFSSLDASWLPPAMHRGDPLLVGSVTVGSSRAARRSPVRRQSDGHLVQRGWTSSTYRRCGLHGRAAWASPMEPRAAYGLVVRRRTMLVHLLMSVQGATSGIPSPELVQMDELQ